MHENDFVGHTSPTSGSAADRVARAGVRTPLVLENIGRGYGPRRSTRADGQPRSSRQRAAAATRPTSASAWSPSRGGSHCVPGDEGFTRVHRARKPTTPTTLLDRINAARAARGVPVLSEDRAMAAIARRGAARYFAASAPNNDEITRQVRGELARTPKGPPRSAACSRSFATSTTSRKLDELLDQEHAQPRHRPRPRHERPDTFPNAICGASAFG